MKAQNSMYKKSIKKTNRKRERNFTGLFVFTERKIPEESNPYHIF